MKSGSPVKATLASFSKRGGGLGLSAARCGRNVASRGNERSRTDSTITLKTLGRRMTFSRVNIFCVYLELAPTQLRVSQTSCGLVIEYSPLTTICPCDAYPRLAQGSLVTRSADDICLVFPSRSQMANSSELCAFNNFTTSQRPWFNGSKPTCTLHSPLHSPQLDHPTASPVSAP